MRFEQIFRAGCIMRGTMKLGVFDSGVGGKAMAASLAMAFPEAEVLVVDDHENVPYGSKTTEQIIALTDAAIQPLFNHQCDVIVIACNSATMSAIDALRSTYPTQKFVGLEPMVKPAALLTKTGVIAVCATPVTLASKRYKWLLDTYARETTVLEPDCSNWARMIEAGEVDRLQIEKVVNDCCEKGADVIVLGCTHYHWIKDLVTEIAAGRATVLEPSDAIARRVRSVLKETAVPNTPPPASTPSSVL